MAWQVEKPGKRVEYILKADRESSAQTKFFLRPLSWEERTEVGELAPMTLEQAMQIYAITSVAEKENRELTPEEVEHIAAVAPMDRSKARQMFRQHALAVRYGLERIEGLQDKEGNPLDLNAAEFVRLTRSTAVLVELGTEILKITGYSEDALKK
jgi:hypothetical protein